MQPGILATAAPEATHDECLERTLIEHLGVRNYSDVVRNRFQFRCADGVLTVVGRQSFFVELLQTRFRSELERAAEDLYGPDVVVRVVLDAGPQEPAPPPPATAPAPQTVAAAATPAALPPSGAAAPERPGKSVRRTSRFDQFVAGPGTLAALAAAQEFSQSAESRRTPLYLYGATGNGKSHLLLAIVHALSRDPQHPVVLHLTAEQFTNHFTNALRSRTLPSFRLKFRGVDALLVDDVDFFDGKPKVQEEFLHTLEQLQSSERGIVLTADRHPRLLSRTIPELQTRFLSGLVCRIEPADLATREQIVARKSSELGLPLPPEAARVIAQKIRAGVRELEGAVQNLRHMHRVSGRPVTASLAAQVVSEIERDCVRVVRLPDIERLVCDMFGVSAEDLRSARRTRTLSEPRMLAMYLARRHTRAAYSEIGQYFGGRNHATVISAEKRICSAIAAGESVRVAVQSWAVADVVNALEQQLLAG